MRPLAVQRPGWVAVLIVVTVQIVCVVTAAALDPLNGQTGWWTVLFAMLTTAALCVAVPAGACLHSPGVVPHRRWAPLVPLTVLGISTLVLPLGGLVYVAFTAVASTAAVYGLRRCLVALEAQRRRAVAERRHAMEERRRLQRDLHDLLGYSLTAVAVQAELLDTRLASGLVPERLEVAELVSLSRKALAEVRAVSAGPRNMSLSGELVSVSTVLGAAGVVTEVEGEAPAVADPRLATTLAAVLREGATNILRHSEARRCRITLREEAGVVVLAMANDGYDPAGDGEPGTGLDSLTARIAAVGGTLTWSHDGEWFRLRAVCPAETVTAIPTARRYVRRPAGSARAAW
ncbi:hypothetical protein J1792_03175 [Streptomyces triculaminicus]|uniref:Signal transduction histidine kinase subgroup 3 dimerisation and phosphoacceptor domain-containing protein n=2 Tax=Streptomyces TaxID=1883 RepID=A0A939FKR9_9ACTN|nr:MULTISPECIES: histidine kinase [Streptomyces]MBO0651832.1 hypothetical protein [Streptomyces triculaminicus]QSY47243.1 hypothetical protein J3S04_17900 [Streptomyces griseocarneus]